MKALYFENDPLKYALYRAARFFTSFPDLGSLSPVRYEEVPDPVLPNARWLKVRNIACGLCGTDIHFMLMDMSPKSFSAAVPGISRKFLGHETVGEVVETGSDAGNFKIGDRVVLRVDWPSCYQMEFDPPCPQCATGSYMLCENLGLRPLPVKDGGGGFSPFMVLHRSQPARVPDNISDDAAVLMEPMACVVHGVLKAENHLRLGARVLIIGGGTIGLLSVAACRILFPETEVYTSARYPFQKKVAEALGARFLPDGANLYEQSATATGGRYVRGMFKNDIVLGGFDVVLDTVGSEDSFQQSLRLTRAGGIVVLLGINFSPGKLDYSPIWAQEVTVVGINCHGIERDGRTSFDIAAHVIEKTPDLPSLIITHRFPMRDYRKALQAFISKRESAAIKIVLEHEV